VLVALFLVSLSWQLPSCAQEVTQEAVLLIATPELQDPNFAESVVLVLFPRNGGPLGVILNRPTRLTLKDAFPDEPHLRDRTDTVYFGGPVRPGGLMFLFRRNRESEGAFPVLEDLYLSNNGALLDSLLAGAEGGVQRYFLGYSGWAPVQLEVEVASGAWHVLPADSDTILQMDPKVMWRELLARATAVKT
jgi:putative transcriptional regulator